MAVKQVLTASVLALVAASITVGFQVVQIDHSQVQFLTADSAQVNDTSDGRVRVLVEGLDSDVGYGVIVAPAGESNWIEARRNGEFPPQVIEAMEGRPGNYLVTGNPGDVYELRIDRHPERPLYDVVTIEGGEPIPPPVEPPAPPTSLERASREGADAANDPPTRQDMKAALSSLLTRFEQQPPSTVSKAVSDTVAAITAVLSRRKGSSLGVDWHGLWRQPVSDVIETLNPATVVAYIAAVRAIHAGL